jgi:hypothetical protein
MTWFRAATLVAGFVGYFCFSIATNQTNLRRSAIERRQLFINESGTEATDASLSPQSLEPERNCDWLPLVDGHNLWDFNLMQASRARISSQAICGPKVLIIGAMKCGTNTLGQLLAKHPNVKINRCQAGKDGCNKVSFQGSASPSDSIWEGHDFTHKRFESYPSTCCSFLGHIYNTTDARTENSFWLNDLSRRLPWTDGVHTIAMDKSPSYLDISQFPEAATVAKHFLPNAKILVTLCDPSLRLVSHYFHTSKNAADLFQLFYTENDVAVPSSFEEFANLLFEKSNETFCQQHADFCRKQRVLFLEKGHYASHLREWQQVFGSENVLVVNMKDNQTKTVQAILEHVGTDLLPPEQYPWDDLNEPDIQFHNLAYEGRTSAYEEYPDILKQLQRYYFIHNQELLELLHQDFPLEWNGNKDDKIE